MEAGIVIRLLLAILATLDGRLCRWEVRCVDHLGEVPS
jgi:hypothetical protein